MTLRLAVGTHRDDARLNELIGELCVRVPEFGGWRDAHQVGPVRPRHPAPAPPGRRRPHPAPRDPRPARRPRPGALPLRLLWPGWQGAGARPGDVIRPRRPRPPSAAGPPAGT
ncbi:MmyB family transcriptional regulator [Streptomyces asiaticus]|uniref:MmyB family transcriptional regulator n=1 Tax=Streptomyces asiaticus TaxID=114695 RepID=UPI0033C6EAF2